MPVIEGIAEMMKSAFKSDITQAKNSQLLLSNQLYFMLLALQLINLLTLVMQLHIVYIVIAIFLLVIQVLAHNKQRRVIPLTAKQHPASKNSLIQFYAAPKVLSTWAIVCLAIAGSIVIAISGRELGLLLSMVHLLCFAYSLKIFELPKRKDLYQLVVLGIFIATSSLIFHQSVYFSIAVIALVFANLMVLLCFLAPRVTIRQQGKTMAKLMLLSLPLTIALFIGFPKLTPFWQVPNVESAKVGLSEQVKIGDIAQLTLSDELAFRVSFKENIPAQSQQYWRALVLEDFDGTTWQQATLRKPLSTNRRFTERQGQAVNAEVKGQGIDYQVITEPSFQSWLFALDFATSEQANIGQRADFSLYYRGIINKTLSYNVTSFPEAILAENLSDLERTLNLTIPINSNPRLQEQGRVLSQRFTDNRQLINHVLAQLNQQAYFYTLQPPRLSGDTLDQFYFDTKAGFCEHYASAFTYLMRAAGIPARMVVGYLGGEINLTGNYLSVYQRNAHAWSEVWLLGQGWVRVDPTAAVDPERVERGFSSNLMREYTDLSSGLFSFSSFKASWIYREIKQQFEALDYQWTRWVIGYTGQRQSQLLQRLLSSLPSLKSIINLILITLVMAITIIFIRFFLPKKNQAHHWQKQYLTIVNMLAKQNLVKETSMTEMQFCHFVSQSKTDLSENFRQLSKYYCQLQYQLTIPNSAPNHIVYDQQVAALNKFEKYYQAIRWQLWKAKFKFN